MCIIFEEHSFETPALLLRFLWFVIANKAIFLQKKLYGDKK